MTTTHKTDLAAYYGTAPPYDDIIRIQSATTYEDYKKAGGVLTKTNYFRVGALLIAADLLPWYK